MSQSAKYKDLSRRCSSSWACSPSYEERSGGLSVVVLQKPHESFTTCDLTLQLPHSIASIDQGITQPLVIVLRVIMAQILGDSPPNHSLAKENQP